MGSKTRLGIYCTKQNPANLVTSGKIKMRLARPIMIKRGSQSNVGGSSMGRTTSSTILLSIISSLFES